MVEAHGSWEQKGRVSLWCYRKAQSMYDGWHITADTEGCASLLKLFDILSSATRPVYRTLPVTDPRTVGADRIFGEHTLRLTVPAKLRLANRIDGAGTIGLADDIFEMALSPEDIVSFSDAVKDVSTGQADFGVGFGGDNTIVRFWWWPKEHRG